jgi:hypothetical protein
MSDNISRTKAAILSLNSPAPAARPVQHFAKGGPVQHFTKGGEPKKPWWKIGVPEGFKSRRQIRSENRAKKAEKNKSEVDYTNIKNKSTLPNQISVSETSKKKSPKIEEISVTSRKMDQSEYDPEFQKAEQKQQDDYVMDKAMEKIAAMPKKDEPLSDDYFVKRAQRLNKESAPDDDYKPSGFKKGGKVKYSPKKKGDKKKVMGTVGEAKKLLGALMAAKAASSQVPPMMAGPPPRGMPMKKGGKAKKRNC